MANSWNKPLPWVKPQTSNETYSKKPHHQTLGHSGTESSTLGEDISIIMSILQVVKSAEVADLAAKFRKSRHGVDRLHRQGAPKGGTAIYYNLSLYCCPMDIRPLINIEATTCRLSMIGHGVLTLVSVYLPPKKKLLRSDLKVLLALGDAVILFGDFNSKNTNWKCNYTNRNGGSSEIELHSDPPVSQFGSPTCSHETRLSIGDCPPLRKTITSWKKVSAVLEETDTPVLNNIPDDIVSTDDIDNAIGALTSHITTVVESSSRKVPAKFDRRELPRDVIELISDKNAALRRAGKYPTCENRSRACALQRKVKARMKEVKNDNWSDLMAEISPSHKAYWRLAKALKTEETVPTPL
ncbi:hypothetical protein EVAR_98636_1 [Eumeta japonica]|uniref:Endonuclease/exonuclease/phosphatase domain-containing protein n=1 Tax=Eumeta variegata TaxID=151549 RepID=A0A4C1XWY6_EUMVA|nr:hypothetical protein EVAR_98636_1 [Eumeta japonica]